MAGKPFQVVSEPSGDRLLLALAEAFRGGLEHCQRAALTLRLSGKPAALYLLAAAPDEQLSYSRIERLAGVLDALQASLAHRLPASADDREVAATAPAAVNESKADMIYLVG
jgi:hypothetical protein